MTSRAIGAGLVCCFMVAVGIRQVCAQPADTPMASYGNNSKAGHYATVNDVRLYYEEYGNGAPLVLIHGNGGNIAGMREQIAFFSKSYRVIVPDCRGRGKSELGKDSLTYMQMTDDIATLLEHLHVDSAYIIGRSDGGIIALLLGIWFPGKVKKIAAFGANVSPDTNAVYPRIVEDIRRERRHAEDMIARKDTTQDWRLIQQRNRLMEFQPHVSAHDLSRIQCPVLILSCDRDAVKEEHTLFIYRSIPRSNLCIFPGETHWITNTNPALFNSTVERFFSATYRGDEMRYW